MIPAPNFKLDGKRILVTGAGRGIGYAVSQALAASGAHVTLCARSKVEINQAVSELQNENFKAEGLICDVTDLSAFAHEIEDRPCFDGFINNAGTNSPKPQQDVTQEDFDAVIGLNLKAAYFAVQAVSKKMIAEKRPGSIVNMSSQMGHVGAANRTLYCASKWAIEGFTKALAVELGGQKIRVNTICPTFIETPMTKPFFEDSAFLSDTLDKIKLGRLGQVNDITGASVFLLSDASSLMTGSAILVDGGWTAH